MNPFELDEGRATVRNPRSLNLRALEARHAPSGLLERARFPYIALTWFVLAVLIAAGTLSSDAITRDSVAQPTPANTASLTWDHPVTNNMATVLFIGLSYNPKSSAFSTLSVTDPMATSLTHTLVYSTNTVSGGDQVALAVYRVQASQTGTYTITANLTTAALFAGGSVAFAGLDTNAPLSSLEVTTGTTGNSTVTVTGLNDDTTLGFVSFIQNPLNTGTPQILTAQGTQTTNWNLGAGTANNKSNGGRMSASSFIDDPGPSHTHSWAPTDNTEAWAAVAFKLNPAPPTISSVASQTFVSGALSTANQTIVVTDVSGEISIGNNIYVSLPGGVGIEWDTSDLTMTPGGTASGKVSTAVSYPNSKTLKIDVTSPFDPGDSLQILDLAFKNFGPPGGSGNLSLDIAGTAGATVSAVDDKTLTVLLPTVSSAVNKLFVLDDNPQSAGAITVTDDPTQALITAVNDIRITIPAGLDMTWDTSITTITATQTGTGSVAAGVTYEDADKTLVVDVTTNFAPGSSVQISGAKFANFATAHSGSSLLLETTNDGLTQATDAFQIILAQPSLSMSANQDFNVGDPVTTINTLTIVESPDGSTINSIDDIRIRIPGTFAMEWDPTDTSAVIGGTAAGRVSTTVSYEDSNHTLVLDVSSEFVAGETLTISGLSFANFTAASPVDNLELEVTDNSGTTAVAAQTIAIGGATLSSANDQFFVRADPATTAAQITVVDNNIVAQIKAATDLRIRIPSGFAMTWDASVTSPVFGGSASAKIAASVSYEDSDKTVVVGVTTDFSPSDSLTISGLAFTNFTGSATFDTLELELGNNGVLSGVDDKTIYIGAPHVESRAPSIFQVGDWTTLMQPITITEDPVIASVTAANDVRIRIPDTLPMTWDTSVASIPASGTALTSGKITSFSFEDGGKVLVLLVDTDFLPGETLIVGESTTGTRGGYFNNFTESTAVPQRLQFLTHGPSDPDFTAADVVTKEIQGINDAPDFAVGQDIELVSDSGAQTFSEWATMITPGGSEFAQTVSFVLAADNPTLFDVQPVIGSSGPSTNGYPNSDLSFTLAAGAVGTTTVSVYAQDDYGTANGGDDTSAVKTFSITVRPRTIARDTTGGANGNSLLSWTHNVSGENRILIVGVTANADSVSAIDYDGVAMTFLAGTNRVFSGGSITNGMWYLSEPSTNGAGTINLTMNGTGDVAAGSVSYTGVNTSTPFEKYAVAAGQSGTASVTIPGAKVNQVIVDSLGVSDFPAGFVADSSTGVDLWDQRSTSGASSSKAISEGSEIENISGDYVDTWDFNGDAVPWTLVAGELLPVGDVEIQSAADQSFKVGDASTTAAAITVTEAAGILKIKAATDIRIRIPAGFNMSWDTSVSSVSLSGLGAPRVLSTVAYEDAGKTIVLDVQSDFAVSEDITITGLKFKDFLDSSPLNNLELEVDNLGSVVATDPATIGVFNVIAIDSSASQSFTVNQNDASISLITVVDDEEAGSITAANDIRIRIPAGFGMTWQTNDTSAGIGGAAAAKANTTVSYEDSGRTLVVDVISDFDPGDTLTIAGLSFTAFSSASAVDNLELIIDGASVAALDGETISVGASSVDISSNVRPLAFDPPFAAPLITVSEDPSVPTINTAGDIRLSIPATANLEWDTTITSITAGGSAAAKISPTVFYDSATVVKIAVTTSFSAGDTLTVSGLQFASPAKSTALTPLELIVTGPGGNAIDQSANNIYVAAPDFSSAADQQFTLNQGDTSISPITITDDAINPTIKNLYSVRIKIPSEFNMEWDQTIVNAAIAGSAKISSAVSYLDSKTLSLTVISDFSAGENFTISGLEYKNFSLASATDNLELEIRDDGVTRAYDAKTINLLAPTISSAANQSFAVGDPVTAIQPITVTDVSTTPQITSLNDIRIRIPAGFNMTWDTSDTVATITGLSSSKVSSTVSYEDAGQTLVINVTGNFSPSGQITISDLGFASFSASSPKDNLELIIEGAGASVAAFDDKTIDIAVPSIDSDADQTFLVGDPLTSISPITIQEHPVGVTIVASNDIRIVIPNGLAFTWDTNDTSATLTGTAVDNGRIGALSYPDSKTLLIDVLSDWDVNETLRVDDLAFDNFSAASAFDTLELVVAGPGQLAAAFDSKFKGVANPTISSSGGEEYQVGDTATAIRPISIATDAAGTIINSADDIRIKIPASLDMTWDTSDTSVTLTAAAAGSDASGKVSGSVSYEDGGKTLVLDVVSEFVGGDAFELSGLSFANFNTVSPAGRLQLWLSGREVAKDDKYLAIGQAVFEGVAGCFSDLTVASSTTVSYSVGSEENRLLLVGVNVYETGNVADAEVVGVSFNGQAMTRAHTGDSGAGLPIVRTEIWYMLEADLPASGSYDLVVTTTGATDERFVFAQYLYNAKQNGPEALGNAAQPVGSSPISAAVTTLTDNAFIFDVLGIGAATSATPDVGQTEICDSALTSSSAAASFRELGTAGLTSMGWSGYSGGSPVSLVATAFAPFSINEPPTLTVITTLTGAVEDTSFAINHATLSAAGNEADPDGDPISFRVELVSSGSLTKGGVPVSPGVTTLASGEQLIWTPVLDAYGAAIPAFAVVAYDGTDVSSPSVVVTIDVAAVNDEPSVVAANVSVEEDSGPQSIAWAALDAGPANEDSVQNVVAYTVSNVSNPSLFSVQPTVSTAGVLSFTPADDEFGVTTFDVVVQDDGGVDNGGDDTGSVQTFSITVTSCNDSPSFLRGPDRVVLAGVPQTFNPWARSISFGPANEAGQTVSFNVSTDNNSLFSSLPTVNSAGVLSFTIAAAATGFARVAVSAVDSGPSGGCDLNVSAEQVFMISTPVHYRRCGPLVATGSGPAALVVLDFLGNDGKRDLAVANYNDDSIGIWTGNGNTTFNFRTNITVGAGPVGMVMNDFNRDGYDDFASANYLGNSVSLIGSRASGIYPVVTIPVGNQPIGISTGDFNGDGRPDIVTANDAGNSISLSMNLGNLAFAPSTEIAVGNAPSAVTASFINSDNHVDIAVANRLDDNIAILLGDGTGNFNLVGTESTGVGSNPIAMGNPTDLNGDGRSDLAVANYNLGTVGVMISKGDGSHEVMVTYATGANPRVIAARDIDFDGDVDLFVCNSGNGSATVLFNDGTGDFSIGKQTAYTGSASSNPVAVALGNFNGPYNGAEALVANFADDEIQPLCYVAPVASHFVRFNSGVTTPPAVLEDTNISFDVLHDLLTRRSVTYSIVVDTLNGSISLDPATGAAVYTPDPDYYGYDSFKFVATGPLLSSNPREIQIYVQGVNDPPSFVVPIPNVSVSSASGFQTIANFATTIDRGAANENHQKIYIGKVPSTVYNKSLFSVQPSIDTFGTMRFEPRLGAVGATSIRFYITDNGGPHFGGNPVGNEVVVTFDITP